MRFRSTTPRAAHVNRDRWSVGHCSASRSSVSRAPPKHPSHCGSGGTDPPRPIWRWCGRPTPPALRLNIPFASSNKPSTGRRPNCAHPPLPIAGRGSCSWPMCISAWRATRSSLCGCPGSHPCHLSVAHQRGCDAQVRRGFSHVLPHLGSPVNAPKPADARRDAPAASALHLLHASQRSN